MVNFGRFFDESTRRQLHIMNSDNYLSSHYIVTFETLLLVRHSELEDRKLSGKACRYSMFETRRNHVMLAIPSCSRLTCFVYCTPPYSLLVTVLISFGDFAVLFIQQLDFNY